MDTAILYVYDGQARVEGHERAFASSIVQFDAESADKRALKVTAVGGAAAAILFAGTKLREPIAWHGPIVMNTQKQLQEVFGSLQRGTFPPKRVAWDYKRISTKPAL
jgi:redox-sensitive bicupin YhaK (pirin superfamily)